MPVRAALAWSCTVAVFLLITLGWSTSAQAYPWMVRHGYQACNSCHVDPSGASVLTEYGRAQADLIMRTHWGQGDRADDVHKSAGFAGGLVEPSEWLLPYASVRSAVIVTAPQDQDTITKYLLMQADLKLAITPGQFRALASLGYAQEGAMGASLTTRHNADGQQIRENNLVSREHWVGVALADDKVLLRAGRMYLPFGIRNIEHNAMARRATRSNINDIQTYGVAVAYTGEKIRGELLGIAGNFLVSPDQYRERGYAGLVEYFVIPQVGVGASSLSAWAKADEFTGNPYSYSRQAHGLFVRATPLQPLVIMAEVDALVYSTQDKTRAGWTSLVQADFEVHQGVHVQLTGETRQDPGPQRRTAVGGWLSAFWFFLPHMDVRADAIIQDLPRGDGSMRALTFLGQFHAYL